MITPNRLPPYMPVVTSPARPARRGPVLFYFTSFLERNAAMPSPTANLIEIARCPKRDPHIPLSLTADAFGVTVVCHPDACSTRCVATFRLKLPPLKRKGQQYVRSN